MFLNKTNNWRAVFLLIALCFVVYGNTLGNQFMMDDFSVLFNKNEIPAFSNILEVFNFNHADQVYYRPVSAFFRVLLGSILPVNPVYYHLINIGLFSLHVVLIFFILKKIFEQTEIALMTSLLYCVHPINSIEVNYITAHEVLLQALFLDLSLISFLWYFEKGKACFFLSVLFFIFSLFTQEISVIFAVVPFFITWQLRKKSFWSAIKTTSPYFIVSVGYILFRTFFIKQTGLCFNLVSHYLVSKYINAFSYFNTAMNLIGWYVGQLFFPTDIVLMHTSVPTGDGWLFRAGILVLIAAGIILMYRNNWAGNKNFFALIWFLSGFIPVFWLAPIYPENGFTLEPHWFFFSSIGFFLWFGIFFTYFFRFNPRLKIIFFVLICGLSFMTRTYNTIWKTQKSYCSYWISIAKDFHFPNFWLGESFFKESKFKEAEFYFKKALVNGYIDWQVFTYLGDINLKTGEMNEAEKYYLKAIDLNPRNKYSYTMLHSIYLFLGDEKKAREILSKKERAGSL